MGKKWLRMGIEWVVEGSYQLGQAEGQCCEGVMSHERKGIIDGP